MLMGKGGKVQHGTRAALYNWYAVYVRGSKVEEGRVLDGGQVQFTAIDGATAERERESCVYT